MSSSKEQIYKGIKIFRCYETTPTNHWSNRWFIKNQYGTWLGYKDFCSNGVKEYIDSLSELKIQEIINNQ